MGYLYFFIVLRAVCQLTDHRLKRVQINASFGLWKTCKSPYSYNRYSRQIFAYAHESLSLCMKSGNEKVAMPFDLFDFIELYRV